MIARYDILASPLIPAQWTFVANRISMRWKLLVIASFAAALVACGLWSALAIGAFGTARELASHGWLFLASTIVPLAIVVYAGVFVYRRTSRRRKTQAVVTVIVALFLTAGAYVAAAQVFPDKLGIPPSRLRGMSN